MPDLTYSDKMRPPVYRFALQMERVLKQNDYKGGWDTCSISYLDMRLQQEIHEYSKATSIQDQQKELTDIANFCMMIYNRLGG